jgi:hypothetical protein
MYTPRPSSASRRTVAFRCLAAAALLSAGGLALREMVRTPAPAEAPQAPPVPVQAAAPAPASKAEPRPAPAPPAPAPTPERRPEARVPAPRAPVPVQAETAGPSDCVPPGREDRRACVSETAYGGGMPALRPARPVPALDGVYAEILGTVLHTLPSAVMPGDGTCGGRGYLYIFRNRGGSEVPPLTLAGRDGGIRHIPRLLPGDTCMIQTPSLLHSIDGPYNDSLHKTVLDPMQKAYRSVMKPK